MSKQNILIISVGILLAGVVGFYGGRYYERETFRKTFESRRQNMMQQNGGNWNGGGWNGGSGQRGNMMYDREGTNERNR